MRRFLIPLAAALLLAAAVTPIVAAADPFTKAWSATDVDGSLLTLEFSGSGDTRDFAYVDWRATSCDGGIARIDGVGTISGNEIALDGTVACDGGPSFAFSGSLSYDPGSGTLSDGTITWHRGNGAREAFLGVWKATDTDGSAMKLTFRGWDLTRDVTYVDDVATSCDPDAVFMAAGDGTIGSVPGQGRFITVSFHGGCRGQGAFDYDEKYRYDLASDTLRGPLALDDSELPYTVDWHRG